MNSARSVARTAPAAAQNAVHPAVSPASAPECAATIDRPRGDPPTVRITTGTSRSAARSSAARSRGPGPGRFHQQPDEPGLRIVERVLDVVGGVGDQFLAGGHRETEPEPPPGAQQGGERRAGMRDQRDTARGKGIGLQIAQRPHPGRVVDEAHAAGAAHRHTGAVGDRGERLAQPGAVRGTEQHGRAGTDRGRGLQLLDDRGIRYAQQHQVGGFPERFQRRRAGQLADAVIARIDQMHTCGTVQRLGDHPGAERVGARAGAHHGHRPGTEHGRHRGPAVGQGRLPSAENTRRLPRFWSARAARAACQPGIPQTPPPAWVAELPLYRPAIGVR